MVLRLLILVAALVAEHRLQGGWAGIWDLLNPGIEPRSPALQADSLPAEPQGKLTVKIAGVIQYNIWKK